MVFFLSENISKRQEGYLHTFYWAQYYNSKKHLKPRVGKSFFNMEYNKKNTQEKCVL